MKISILMTGLLLSLTSTSCVFNIGSRDADRSKETKDKDRHVEIVTKVVEYKPCKNVIASSTLSDQAGNNYNPRNLSDSNSGSVWACPFTGSPRLTFMFDPAEPVDAIKIRNGYQKSMDSFINNSRAKDIDIFVNDVYIKSVRLVDAMEEQEIFLGEAMSEFSLKSVDVLEIVINSVYRGAKWNDLCISDISFRS